MSYENKPGSGALFKRDKKGERQPDYSGPYYEQVGDGVVERQIAAWIRKSKKGETYLSIQVTDRFEAKRVGPPIEAPKPDKDAGKDFDNEIPGW